MDKKPKRPKAVTKREDTKRPQAVTKREDTKRAQAVIDGQAHTSTVECFEVLLPRVGERLRSVAGSEKGDATLDRCRARV